MASSPAWQQLPGQPPAQQSWAQQPPNPPAAELGSFPAYRAPHQLNPSSASASSLASGAPQAMASFNSVRWPQQHHHPQLRPGFPPGTALPYQAYQAAPGGQWLIQGQRPFLYPPNFSLPYQRPEAMRHPFPSVWGQAVAGQTPPPKELPDFHAHKTTTMVTPDENIVSDAKPEKVLKIEVSEEDAWAAHKTEGGVIYYYNSVTGESTYDKPANFKGEAANVTSQPTPVSVEKVPGTDWLLVATNDNKNYYYNTTSKETSWQMPPELVELARKQTEEPMETPAAISGGREAKSPTAPSALDAVKKKLHETSFLDSIPLPDPEPAKLEKEKKEKETADSTTDSSSESEQETQALTKEERVAQFKEMLKEKGVAPFSKWEKELPRILFDPRFKAIPTYIERRSIFDIYVRTRADEERKEKRAKHKAAVDGFKELLDEAGEAVDHTTQYETFVQVWGQDARFEALERKDRENLFNERIAQLKRAEQERVKSIYEATAADFKALLKASNVTTTSRWSKVKDSVRDDPRYGAVSRDKREEVFNSYIAELRASEMEAERASRAKREEEMSSDPQTKLKEREREMRKRKERDEQELDRVRAKARRKDAVTAYLALLTEKIKDAEASWTESRPKLEKDSLGRFSNPELDHSTKERLFRDHVKELYERYEKDYRALLEDAITVEGAAKHSAEGKDVITSWSDAKQVLSSDLRFNRMPRRGREALWRRHVETMKAPSTKQQSQQRQQHRR